MTALQGYFLLADGQIVKFAASAEAGLPQITILGNIFSSNPSFKNRSATVANLRYDSSLDQLNGLIAFKDGGLY